MWFGIKYLDKSDGVEEEHVIVSIWDDERPLRVGGRAEQVADIVCALREVGGDTTAMPRCDACHADLGAPDLDSEMRAA